MEDGFVSSDYIYSNVISKLRSICIANIKKFPNMLIILNEDVITDFEPNEPHISFKSLGLDWKIGGRDLEFIYIKDYESVLCKDYYLAGELCLLNKVNKDMEGTNHAYLKLVSRIKYKKDDIPCVYYKPSLYLRIQNDQVIKTEELEEGSLSSKLKNFIVSFKLASKNNNVILVEKDDKRIISNLNKSGILSVEDVSSKSHLNSLVTAITQKEKEEGNSLEYIVGLFEGRKEKEGFEFFKRYWYEGDVKKVGYTIILE